MAVRKRLVLILLIVLSVVVLLWGIRQYRLFYEWLEPRHIEGLALMGVIAFGLTAVFIPFVVRQDWKVSSVKDVFIHYMAAFGLMFGALAAVFTLLWLLGWVWLYLRAYPVLLIMVIAILAATGYILDQNSKRESK